nr:MAG TPA: minor capsid protein [Caudoviricetes sp.]
MLNTDYDIEKAFKAIEDELIASMMRNLASHRAEETNMGFNWSQWQVEQLKALEKYKAQNKKKFTKSFSNINDSIDAMIFAARQEGGTEQEQKILRALKKGLKASKVSQGTEGAFFRLNTRKLEALIKATKNDFGTAEKAMLRMSEDKYRQIIFNAEVYAATGAGTYEKAVDMATKDFLKAGINCIEYSNGARHSMKSYAKMAIQTACKRAYLTGEGEMRQSWGISTVIMNKRANACPKCLPFVGKILIDDVWSGGKASDGPYPLMSSAMAAGLYHPNCKDVHTTYFPELDEEPDSKFSKEELEQVKEDYRQDQKQQHAGRMVEQFDRLSRYSLDPDNQKMYAARKEQWEQQLSDSQEYRPIIRGDSKTIEVRPDTKVDVKKINTYQEDIYVSDNVDIKPRTLHEIYTNTVKAFKKWDISKDRMPEIRILSKDELKAYGKYDAVNNVVYYIPEIANKDIVGQKGVTEYHEMWHMKQAEKFRSKGWNITKENYSEYIRELNKECKKTIDALGINEYNVGKISDYAKKMYFANRYDEVEAEYMTLIKRKG